MNVDQLKEERKEYLKRMIVKEQIEHQHHDHSTKKVYKLR